MKSHLTPILAILLSVLGHSTELHGAAFASTQDGQWENPATWGGAGIPAVGDTVTVSHQITTAGSLTIGHSPGANHATAAVQINGGTLTIGPSTAFTCRGDIRIQPGTLVLEPGSTLEMDSSQASNPATSIYVIDIVPTYGSNDALLSVLGTAAAHARIRAHPAGAHTRIADGNYTPNGGRMIATYCDFERLGGSPDYQAWFYGPTAAGDPFRIEDCTFDQCSRIAARSTVPAGGCVEFIRCIWRNSIQNPGGNDYWEIYSGGSEAGAINRIIQCDFDKRIYLGSPWDYEIEGCVFRDAACSVKRA